MKKLYWNILSGIWLLILVIACTKEITEDAIETSFSIEFKEKELTSILNIPETTTFMIKGAGFNVQEDFKFKYNVTQGAGFFVIDEQVIQENEFVSLSKGPTFTIEYVGIESGDHKVSIAVRNSRNDEKEIQLVYNVKDTAFEVTVVPKEPFTYVGGIADLDFAIVEAVPATYDLLYNFVGADADGAGEGTILTNGIAIKPGKEVRIENKEKFTLQFIGTELGIVQLEIVVKSNLEAERKKEIKITIAETPEFTFTAIPMEADPTTNRVETFVEKPVTINFEIKETVGSSSYTGMYTSTKDGKFVYNEITYTSGQEIPMEAEISTGKYIGAAIGDHEIVFTVVNANTVPVTRKAEFTIVCKDPELENPVITLLGDNPLIWDVNKEFVDPGFSVVDNDDPEIESKVMVTGSVDVTRLDTFKLSYDVQDASGNRAETKVREVIVKDKIAPIISLNGEASITLMVGSVLTDPTTASDNYESDDEITQKIVYGGDYTGTSKEGSYTRTYNVSDASGNAAEVMTREIKVVGDMSPVITIIGDNPLVLNAVRDGVYSDQGATATDDLDDDLLLTEKITTSGTVDITKLGDYKITYSVTDSGMNITIAERTVNVIDNEAPVISLNSPMSIMHRVNTPYTDSKATAIDNVDDSVDVIVTGNVDIYALGPNALTYKATDSKNNEASITKTVDVIDDVKPVIQLNGESFVALLIGQRYEEKGATVSDNYHTDINPTITGSVDENKANFYTLRYDAIDYSGNEALPVSRTVLVANAPVARINPRNVTGKVPFTVNFNAYDSTSDGIITDVKWNFGDGSPLESHDDEDPPIPHTFTKTGTFTVSIEITDEYGFKDTTSTTVTVTN